MTSDVIWVIVCLAGSGFFSASETALSSLPITRLEALRESCGRLTRAGLDLEIAAIDDGRPTQVIVRRAPPV